MQTLKNILGRVLAIAAEAARLVLRSARVAGSLAVRAASRVARSRFVLGTLRIAASAGRVALFSGAIVALALLYGCLFYERIPAGSIGVKQVNFGGRGIVEQDYGTGLAFSVPLYHAWHFVDRTSQMTTFGWESEGGTAPILDVRTRDGNVANVGVAVPNRVRDGEGWQLVKDGLKSTWRQRAKSTIEKVLLQELGALSTTELQSTDARRACLAAALPRLNEQLALYHVEAEALLVTQVWFGAQYEKKLQEKQLTAQEALLQEARREVDAQRERIELFQQEIDASEKTIVAEMDQEIERRFAEGRKRINEVRAATKFYDQTRRDAAQSEADRLILEGDQLLARAEAQKQELLNKALATSGGRLLLARQAAENLNIRQVTLNSNDPRVPSVLDVDGMVRLLVGTAGSAQP